MPQSQWEHSSVCVIQNTLQSPAAPTPLYYSPSSKPHLSSSVVWRAGDLEPAMYASCFLKIKNHVQYSIACQQPAWERDQQLASQNQTARSIKAKMCFSLKKAKRKPARQEVCPLQCWKTAAPHNLSDSLWVRLYTNLKEKIVCVCLKYFCHQPERRLLSVISRLGISSHWFVFPSPSFFFSFLGILLNSCLKLSACAELNKVVCVPKH